MEKYAPWKLIRGKKKYILEKMYPNHALYSNLENGLRECFTFHELGMIKEMVEPPKYLRKPENVIY